MLKVLNWHCGLVCGSVWDLRVVLNSSALVTDIDIISPLQTPRSRASNEGSRRLCKDFTITEKAPTRDLLGAFFVIVKYSFEALPTLPRRPLPGSSAITDQHHQRFFIDKSFGHQMVDCMTWVAGESWITGKWAVRKLHLPWLFKPRKFDSLALFLLWCNSQYQVYLLVSTSAPFHKISLVLKKINNKDHVGSHLI